MSDSLSSVSKNWQVLMIILGYNPSKLYMVWLKVTYSQLVRKAFL
jgi:hypothetical protein